MEHQQKLSSQLYYFRKDRYIYMELKFVIPNMEKTFGNLEFAGEDKTEQRRINGRMAVLSRSFNLYSDVQRADDIVVILPAEAGEKHFDFEERVKLVNPRITAEGYKIGTRGFTNYILHADDIVEDVLRLKLPYFIHEDYGFYSYTEHYYLGDIFVLVSPELEKGVLLELKGRGCRQFESYLLAQERSWYEFFMDVLMEDGVMKRLDLAINDKTGILNIPHLTEKCRNEECISVFRSFKSYRSGELVRREEKECMGNTLYIGSLQSEVYFCIYEKDYEQYKKHDIPIADAEVKNRFEIRLKNERAFYAIRDLLEHDNPERTAFQIINRYVRFVDRDDTKPRSDWRISEEWAWFIGEHRGSLKLTTKPEPYSFERTLHWLSHQVAPTLKLALRLDKMNHTQIVHDIITHARLTEKHEKILKQQAADAKEVVL